MSETAVVTLLFCDLVGSTELLRSLGDDANDEVRRSLLGALGREANSHGGTVVKTAGDGMMVSFQTSAADAVACAIAIQRAAAVVERNGVPLGLELRVGISSGEASHEDGDWFGTPVVEAARLESAAQAGQILVSEVVRSIVGTRGGAQFRSAGTRELKGFARPVPVVEVVWRDASTPPPVKRKKTRSKQRVLVAAASLVVVAAAAITATVAFALRESGEATDTIGASLPLVADGYVPTLEPRDCPADLTTDPTVLCHDLIVPEDRAIPTGRQIRIFLMVAPSKAEPPGVPTVFIGDLLGTIYHTLTPGIYPQPGGLDVREYGEVVAVGVRGRKLSQPMLACPEVSAGWRERLSLPMNGPEGNNLFLDAAERCGKRLVSEGVDLNAYGQDEIVDDVRDLAIAMGWRQINVQGSYDLSRVAVLLAARYPGLVRSVVLADPFPVDAAWYDDRLVNANSAWLAYAAACSADPACANAFPGLAPMLPALHAIYQQEPPVIPAPDPTGGPDIEVLFDGDRLIDLEIRGLSIQFLLPIFAGLLRPPDDLTPSQIESALQTGANYAVLSFVPDPDGDPWGATFSAYCEDVNQGFVAGALAAAETLYPLYRVLAHDPVLEVCPRWPTEERPRTIGRLETTSAVPALIIGGELDPLAPPAYAMRAANAFTNPTVAVFPSHTGWVLFWGPPCVTALRLAFLRDPAANLEDDIADCIAKVQPIAFAGT